MKKKKILLQLGKQKISSVTQETMIAGKEYTNPENECVTWETFCGQLCFETENW